VNDLWIDSSHINHERYRILDSRRLAIGEFMRKLRREYYSGERNDYKPYYLYSDSDAEEVELTDDEDETSVMYRKTLDFPDYPENSVVLEPQLLTYCRYSCDLEKIRRLLESLPVHQRIQAILSFRTGYQITSGK
jgi:hypothetical protein